MTKSQRMKPVLQVASAREQDAARDLGLSQRHLGEQYARLNELYVYRNEYLQQTADLGSAGINVTRYIEMQRFLNNLNTAIEQQQQMVAQAARLCEERKRSWQEAHTKSKSLNRVVQHYVRQELHDESRREQKTTDEIAQHKRRRDIDSEER